MKLKRFKVSNYKIFEKEFSVDLTNESKSAGTFTILTGKNNMGKSTFLEAINEFYKVATKALCIKSECFNNKNLPIIFSASLSIDSKKDNDLWKYLIEKGHLTEAAKGEQQLNITKRYTVDTAGTYAISLEEREIHIAKEKKDIIVFLNKESPYYIRPNMTTEEIDKIINTIYTDAISASSEKDNGKLDNINYQIKTAIETLKLDTDQLLKKVEFEVTTILNTLFKDQNFKIKIDGGEVHDYSIKDLLKNTDTKITIDSNSRKDMLLAEQGTGVQRMSLIYTIQKIIKLGIGNLGSRMLLIDEPEAFLHPEAIRQLSVSLYEIGNVMPIIITTHSPVLINLENNHTVIDIFKIDKSKSNAITLYTSSEESFNVDDIENMKILNYVNSYVNEFFFSDKNIVVEGSTEKLVLQYIQKQHNIPFHVINANGKSTIGTIMKILNKFDVDYYVLHDIDNNPNFKDESTLKSEKTKCINLLNLKTKNTKIFAHDFTFEKAFYDQTVSSNKTKEIYEILHSKNTEIDKYAIRQKILSTYNKIFDLGIEELNTEECSDKVIPILKEEDILEKFSNLISK